MCKKESGLVCLVVITPFRYLSTVWNKPIGVAPRFPNMICTRNKTLKVAHQREALSVYSSKSGIVPLESGLTVGAQPFTLYRLIDTRLE